MATITSPSPSAPHFLVLGAGVIGLSTALTLHAAHPSSLITIIAKHTPGDRSVDYTSPWAGANWCTAANDSGPLEHYDAVTFAKLAELAERVPEAGVRRMPLVGIFDAPIEDTGILSRDGKMWFEGLVGGVGEVEVPKDGKAVFGIEFKSTIMVNSQVYLGWLQAQVLSKGIRMVKREYSSIKAPLKDFPDAALLVNATGLGSLKLEDVRDTNLYPTRGQTVLVAEPRKPISRMYFRSPKRLDPETTYVFPRPVGGGVILGGSRQEGDWNPEVDMELAKDIMERCCKLCPELGKPEELEILSHNVGLRPSRKGGMRIEVENRKEWSVPVVHCYGHSGTGYQSSW
ncbi:hypothetical protein EJ04DRAFT_442803 [Polyplosphaeria fusca]|uniref:FAD dependent oxidoreductase domain-containing protein n=1 Tax=Polyplosphaeria fusca TaxID=682080 RepID=A0A9P4QV89_9PLEO|nr:hypothetical protein EJ04DRAFT_442803 [Polyplosphaeria fusca]